MTKDELKKSLNSLHGSKAKETPFKRKFPKQIDIDSLNTDTDNIQDVITRVMNEQVRHSEREMLRDKINEIVASNGDKQTELIDNFIDKTMKAVYPHE